MVKCLNCDNMFDGNYCNHCGQKKDAGKPTLKMVTADFVQNVFLFDSRLYKTLIALLISPGKMVKTYLSGKRKAYLPPFQLFLLFLTIYLLLFSYLGDNVFELVSNDPQSIKGIRRIEVIRSLVRRNMDILYFIFTPIVALYTWLFFKKSGYNYPQVLIFSLYIVGVNFLLSSCILTATLFAQKTFIAKVLIIFGYFPYAIVQFTGASSLEGILKSLLTMFISYLTFIFIVLIFALSYLFLFVG